MFLDSDASPNLRRRSCLSVRPTCFGSAPLALSTALLAPSHPSLSEMESIITAAVVTILFFTAWIFPNQTELCAGALEILRIDVPSRAFCQGNDLERDVRGSAAKLSGWRRFPPTPPAGDLG